MHLLLSGHAHTVHYLTWGWASISVPNLIIISVTTALLVLALVLPFPKDRQRPQGES